MKRALEGRLTRAQRWVLAELLDRYEELEAAIKKVNEQIRKEVESPDPFVREAIELLDTIPGVGEPVAQIIVSEIGVDMRRFPATSTWQVGQGCAQATMNRQASARAGRRRKGANICGQHWCKQRGQEVERKGHTYKHSIRG